MIHLNNFSNIICLLSFEHVFSYLKESTFIVINSLLEKQVKSSVKWSKTIEKMLEEGIDTFIEIGPSKTLSSFVKEISRNKKANLNIFNVEDLKSLDKTLEGVEIKC